MKNKLMYIMLLGAIVLPACQANYGAIPEVNIEDNRKSQIEQRQEENQPEGQTSEYVEDQNEALVPEGSPSLVKEKTVTVGVSGFEEDVTLIKFSNEWLSLWYDPSLEVVEKQDDIRFLAPSNEVSFNVERLDKEWKNTNSEETLVNKYNEKGYKLINQFKLDYREGWGYIFYSYEQHHSLDVYFLKGDHKSIKIEFLVPDDEMEQYIMRFEYMLETVEILS